MWKINLLSVLLIVLTSTCNQKEMEFYSKEELNKNSITSLDEMEIKVKSQEAVLSLQIKDYKESQLPSFVFEATDLQRLSIFYSMVTEIPNGVSKLKNLQYLHAASCPMKSVTPGIGKLKNLREIAIGNCQLDEIPIEIGQCKELRIVRFETNKITTLPAEINQLVNLVTLDLEDNYLTALPSLNKLINLEELSFTTNEIVELNDNAFEGLNNLKKLKIGFNPFAKLPSSITSLDNLEELHMNGCSIESFPEGFESMKSLKKIFIKSARKMSKDALEELHSKMPNTVIYY